MSVQLRIGASVVGAAVVRVVIPRLLWLIRGPRCDYATHGARLPDDSFADKVVWITGASAGIGAAFARAVAARGARLVLTSRRLEALNSVADALPCPRDRVVVIPADLASASGDELRELAVKAASAFPSSSGSRQLHYLVNNAGSSTRALAEHFHDENLTTIIQLNFVAPVTLSRAVLPFLRETNGAIVNTSSIASIVNTALRAPYCAVKAALSRWHECLRLELLALPGPRVDIVDVCPGSVATDIARNAMVGDAGKRAGVTDVNIENGLDVDYVGERMAAAVYQRLEAAWIMQGREFIGTYVAYYLPGVFRTLFRKTILKEFAKYMRNAERERSSRGSLGSVSAREQS